MLGIRWRPHMTSCKAVCRGRLGCNVRTATSIVASRDASALERPRAKSDNVGAWWHVRPISIGCTLCSARRRCCARMPGALRRDRPRPSAPRHRQPQLSHASYSMQRRQKSTIAMGRGGKSTAPLHLFLCEPLIGGGRGCPPSTSEAASAFSTSPLQPRISSRWPTLPKRAPRYGISSKWRSLSASASCPEAAER